VCHSSVYNKLYAKEQRRLEKSAPKWSQFAISEASDKTFSRQQAKTFIGILANQNIVLLASSRLDGGLSTEGIRDYVMSAGAISQSAASADPPIHA